MFATGFAIIAFVFLTDKGKNEEKLNFFPSLTSGPRHATRWSN